MRERIVAIYARVSTEHEAQLSALENQVQYYDNILANHPEFKLYKRYIDEGITGTSTKKRKNFMKIMEDAEQGCFDLVITREVSRFARNTVDTLQETRKLKRMGIEVWFTEDNIWTMNDEDGELRLTIMATLAQNESKKTSLRVRAGQMVSFQNAVPYGNGNILGYNRVGKEYVINEEQAETVRMIYRLYLEGNGVRKIQYALEQAGRLTATGMTNWSCAVINRTLMNAFYCGTVVYRKQYTPDYLEQKKINNHGEGENVVVEGKHEPIISKEDFNEVQKIHATRSKTSLNHQDRKVGIGQPENIWSKKLQCHCGHKFNRKVWSKSKNTKLYAYQCNSSFQTGTIATRLRKGLSIEGICDSPMVSEWKLQMMASAIFKYFWNDKAEVLRIADELLEQNIVNELHDDEKEKLEALQAQLDKTQKKLSSLVDMRLLDDIPRELYLEKKDILERQRQELIERINDLQGINEIQDEDIEDKLKVLKYALDKDFSFDDESEVPEEIIEAFVKKIVVYKDYYEWHLSFFNDKGIKCLVDGNHRRTGVPVILAPSSTDNSTGSNR